MNGFIFNFAISIINLDLSVIMNKIYLRFIKNSAAILLLVFMSVSLYAQDNEVDSVAIYYKDAFRLYSADSTQESFNTIQKYFHLSDEEVDKEKRGRLYGLQGYIFLSRGATLNAIESFSMTKNIGFELDDLKMVVSGYHGLGRTYVAIKDFDRARINLELGLKYSIEINYYKSEAIMYNALGLLEDSQGNKIKALKNYHNFLQRAKAQDDTLSIVYAYVNISESYLELENKDSSFYYLNLAAELNNIEKSPQAAANIYSNYGRLAFLNNEYQKAIDLINKSLKISFDNNFSNFILTNYYVLIDNYKAINDNEKAIQVYSELDNYKDSIHEINDARKYETINSYTLIKEKDSQTKLWKQKFKNRNIILLLTILLTTAVIILLFILNNNYKENKLKFKSENKDLSDTIDEKNRELVTRIMSENQHDSIISIVNDNIDKINRHKTIDEVKDDLQALKKEIVVKEQIASNWDSFKIQFEQVHTDFFNSLQKIEPNLTNSELRMCAYIKMNMTTKEIANILNISDRSIQTSRYRLKKKLGLDSKIDLITYIQAV